MKTKKVVAPVKEFVAGQLAFQDTFDGGRGNSTTTTRLVLVRSIEKADAVVVLEDGSLAIVYLKDLRHLPEAFKGAIMSKIPVDFSAESSTQPSHEDCGPVGGAPIQAHSKTQYKRLVAQGANVLPPGAPSPDALNAWASELRRVVDKLHTPKKP